MKRTSKGPTRRIEVRAVVAYPAVTVALVVALALALTPFGPSRVMALDAPTTPTATAEPTPTSDPTSTSIPTTTTTSDPTATTPTPDPTDPSATTTSVPVLTPSPVPAPSPGTAAGPPAAAAYEPTSLVTVDHYALARIEGSPPQAGYLPVDAPVLGASQYQSFRVLFQLRNTGADPITAIPQLEYRPVGGDAFVVVPETSKPGAPFRMAREWVPSPGLGGGTVQGPRSEDITVDNLRIGAPVGGVAVSGRHSMEANPDAPVTLAATAYTEQQFTVALTMDATYLAGYELRITDAGTALAGTQITTITLGSPPPLKLSPGQRQGLRVDTPGASSTSGAAYPLVSAGQMVGDSTSVTPVTSDDAAKPVQYALASGSLSPAAAAASSPATSAAIATPSDIHGPYSMTADQCATCHRGHAAKARNLLAQSEQSTLCFSCHDGTGAADGSGAKDVKSQYTDLQVPANKPGSREYYSHDALAPSTTHTRSELDEFGGASNRHSECADCHNSHKAKGTDSTQTPTGWDASGKLAGTSGVAVTNGAAGSAPTYAFLNGVTDLVTREYQLCFKCHSGSTTLTSNEGLEPSQYALDKGVELNPNNPSFHPVEAAGTNQSTKMAASLAGSSPYKLWNFNTGSTIRCLNCHAGGATPDAATPPPPAGSDSAPHASSNRGILLRNYQDRELKSATTDAAYSAGDFALCFVCHGEEPFANDTDAATNFSLHGRHLTGLEGKGDGGTDIDTAGDGQGNALCAECHFRIHSTTNKVGTQEIPGSRLLNFAPNVLPVGGTLSWTPGATGGGSCTLTCHGYEHKGLGY